MNEKKVSNHIEMIENDFLRNFYCPHRDQTVLTMGPHLSPLTLLSMPVTRLPWVTQTQSEQVLTHDMMLVSQYEELAIATQSVDVVYCPHVLENSADPHAILREIERILTPEGYLVVTGFNPWGWSNLLRYWYGLFDADPWLQHWLSYARVSDWLKLLDFDVKQIRTFLFRPLLTACLPDLMNMHHHTLSALPMGDWRVGALYVMLAQKKVHGMTPVGLEWKFKIPHAVSLAGVGVRRESC